MNDSLLKEKIKNTVLEEASDATVILFGSHARGTHSKESDWDILVLLNKPSINFKDEQKIRHKLFDVELESEQAISTLVYSLNDWNTRLNETPLFHNIQREGIYLC